MGGGGWGLMFLRRLLGAQRRFEIISVYCIVERRREVGFKIFDGFVHNQHS